MTLISPDVTYERIQGYPTRINYNEYELHTQ